MNRCVATALAALLLLLAGCGGSAKPDLPGPGNPAVSGDGMKTTVLRNTSGVPIGVRVVWNRSEDGDHYHLYRSANAIPDTARGDNAFWVSINGDTSIPQPVVPGLQIFVDDIFPVAIGETWRYRVTALNAQNEESLLSQESQITISPFVVQQLLDVSVRVGSTFRVQGLNFGEYNALTDKVRMPGVQWVDKIGFSPVMLDCSVTDWTPGQITAVLPLGATKGQVEVSIAGDAQLTPEEMDNADPYITSINPVLGVAFSTVELLGAHFGPAASPDNRVVFDGADVAGVYPLYQDDKIDMEAPNLRDYKTHTVAVRVFEPALGVERDSNVGKYDLRNAPPVVYLEGSPGSGAAPLSVTFKPAKKNAVGDDYSYDPEGPPLTEYRYDFESDGVDDIVVIDSTDIVHVYPKKGTYTCTLTCVDADGAQAQATLDTTVGTEPPVAKITGNPSSGHVPLHVNFSAGGSFDPDGSIVKYEWDFDGDGTYDLDSGSNNKADFYYNAKNSYNATVRVTDNDGATDTEVVVIDAQAGDGKPILIIRDDGGLYQANYDALLSDLKDLNAGYDELPYYSTIADGVDGGGYRLAIWYRGGPADAADNAPYTTAWSDAEIDNYLKIMQDGNYVLLFSENHGQLEGNEGSVANAWARFYSFSVQPDTLTQAQKRFSWAAGLATDLFVQVPGVQGGIPTNPNSFTTGTFDTHFGADSGACAELYNGLGSSGQVPQALSVGSAQYCGAGYNSGLVPPLAVSSGFTAGLYVLPTMGGSDCGMLSWGNSQAPDSNIGSGPNYSHVAGPGKLYIIGYGWAATSVTAPTPMLRSAVLKNIVAWFAGDILP